MSDGACRGRSGAAVERLSEMGIRATSPRQQVRAVQAGCRGRDLQHHRVVGVRRKRALDEEKDDRALPLLQCKAGEGGGRGGHRACQLAGSSHPTERVAGWCLPSKRVPLPPARVMLLGDQ